MNKEKRVAHLWNFATSSLDGDTHAKQLLKSNMINFCRKIAGSSQPIFSKAQMCPHCALHWEENTFDMKLKPQGLQITTNKARKLIDKLKKQQNCPEERLLTKKQKQRAKWLLKRAESKLEINCNFCKHKTQITLDKTNKEKAAQKAKEVQIKTEAENAIKKQSVKSKRKKKNNKDKEKSAGLKIPNVQKEKSTIVPKVTKIAQKTEPQRTKSKQKAKPPKIQSKTQKQNSLLQLAALLKSQDNSNKNVKNHLDKFLK